MKTILETLSEICKDAFISAGFDGELGTVTKSDRPDICQFQCNGALKGAKIYKCPPFKIANAVTELLKKREEFEKVDMVMPGFINLTLKNAYVASFINKTEEDEHKGMPQVLENQKVLVDYGGPNVAKPLHIGHLRSAIIGEALKRMANAAGAEAVGDIHLGDWGLQMGLVIYELRFRHPEWRCFQSDFDPEKDEVPEIDVKELNEVYPCASKKSKEDEWCKNEAKAITAELQKKHPGYYALWKAFMKVSKADMKGIYDRLNVNFEYWYGESDAEDYVDKLLDILISKNLLVESEGAKVVDVSREDDNAPMPPVIIKKSDNSNIYATTDLATILQRKELFNPDHIWYVVDKRQGLHFTQVFRCAHLAGLVEEHCSLEHLGFGTMNGPDGKPFKTRDGGVMQLCMLLDTAYDCALKSLAPEKFRSEEHRIEVAKKLSVASVKFGDLVNNRSKDYVFDFDKFLSCEGKTGAYLLYTVTRITSLLNRSTENSGELLMEDVEYTDAELQLLLALADVGEYFEEALEERAPNYICEAAYQIASAFSTFYHDVRILSEEDEKKRKNRLTLCKITKKKMLFLTNLLGIETVDVM